MILWTSPFTRRDSAGAAGISDLDRPGLIERVPEAAHHPTATLPDLPCRGRRQRLERPPLLACRDEVPGLRSAL